MATMDEIMGLKGNPPCRVCNLPLSESDVLSKRKYCLSGNHNKCAICGNPTTHEMLERAIASGSDCEHQHCRDQRNALELKRKPVVITQELLDWHNERRLIFDVDVNLTVNANQTLAAGSFRSSRWVHEMPLDQLFILMKKMEAVAAEASIILSESKRKEQVRKEREAKDKSILKSTFENRVSEARAKEIKRNRFTPDEKAIKAMCSIPGFTREMAIKELTDQKIKKLLKEHADWNEARAVGFLENPEGLPENEA